MKNRWFRTLILLILLLLCGAHFGGIHFAKKWLNENGKELLGRRLQVGAIGVNYLTAAITVEKVTLYEADDQTPFISFDNLYVNIGLLSILKGDGYAVESAKLDGFIGNVIYKGESFNFDSLVEHFTPSEKDGEPDVAVEKEPVKWFVKAVSISNSTITYHDLKIGEELTVQNVNITLPNGIARNALGVSGNLNLDMSTGGEVMADFEFKNDYSSFKTDLVMLHVENEFLLPYIQDYLLVSDVAGSIGMDIHLAGSLTTPGDLDLSGTMRLDSTGLFDLNGDKLFGIGGLVLAIDSINPSRDVYAARSVSINEPYGWFQLYENGNNLSKLLRDMVPSVSDSLILGSDTLITEEAAADSLMAVEEEVAVADHSSNFFMFIGEYAKQAMKDIQVSDFRLDSLTIEGLEFDFEDHTMLMPFKYSTDHAELHSYGISSASDSVMVYSSAILGDAGKLNLEARLDPTLHEDFKVNLQLSEIALIDISPYFYQYLAHRVENGFLQFNADVDIQSGQLNSLLHLRVDSLEISDKEKHEEALKLPVKLAVKVLKGKSGIIDLEVPVVGDLKDPEYKLGKAIGKIFKNLITKSANEAPQPALIDSTATLPIDSLVLPIDSIVPVGR